MPDLTGPPPSADTLRDGLVQTSFAVTAVLSRVAATHDLSLTQLRMLGILRDQAPRMAELADHLGLEQSTVSGLIDRAVRRGLVQRVPAPDDGRVVRVTFTTAGHALTTRIERDVTEQLEPLIRRLGAAEQRRLSTLLGKMAGRA